MYKIVCYGKSDIGLKRRNNEDAFIIKSDLGFLALADGMGGEASGEVASQIFAETAFEVFHKNKRQSEQETLELVQKTFRLANERILNQAEKNPLQHKMGCTAELIAFCNQNFVLGHVGDSRTYLFRQGNLRQITLDHSFVQDLIDHGLITKLEARKHSKRNVIHRAVGLKEMLSVDIVREVVLPEDFFVLCSDGLTDMVDDSIIEKVLLSSTEDLSGKVEQLINLAKSAGGKDNITVALCNIVQ